MNRFLKVIKRKKNVRRILATAFLLVFLLDIGSHGVLYAQDSWCADLHHTSPSADCPHKRHPSVPQSGIFDEVTHQLALLASTELVINGIVYDTPGFETGDTSIISRDIAPPFHPPKQG